MLKVPASECDRREASQAHSADFGTRADRGEQRARIALLSNPESNDNFADLPRIRAYCAQHPDVFHYEIEQASQIGEAMTSIARIRPSILAINGGELTVERALRELTKGDHFGDSPPPVAVLQGGRTKRTVRKADGTCEPVLALEWLLSAVRSHDPGVYVEPREMTRKHPLVECVSLLRRLLRSGAARSCA